MEVMLINLSYMERNHQIVIADKKTLQNAVNYLLDMFQVLKSAFHNIKSSTIVFNTMLTKLVKNVTVHTIT